jgi:pyrophosphate--fructose-6-phosphate 1-phosphotransferase
MVEDKLKEMRNEDKFHAKFSTQRHFLGYEGRAAFPTNFDADYCYSLGFTAFLLLAAGANGYLSSVRNLAAPRSEWHAGGIPLTMMMNLEMRHGKMKPVIQKAYVDLEGKPFKTYTAHRKEWAAQTSFTYPGSIQYFGPAEIADAPSMTLQLESKED